MKDIFETLNKGTTTLGFVYNSGVVLAVDSRATMGTMVSSQTVEKVVEITPYLLGTIAGGAADCKFWQRVLGRECRLYELRNKGRLSVNAASKLFSNIVYRYKGYGLSIGSMLAGIDNGKAALYYVDSEGIRVQGDKFCVGSGFTYAYGVLDSALKSDMTEEEACELGRRAIYHATFRDSYSGGIVNGNMREHSVTVLLTPHVYVSLVFHVNADGWIHKSATDSKELHSLYAKESRK